MTTYKRKHLDDMVRSALRTEKECREDLKGQVEDLKESIAPNGQERIDDIENYLIGSISGEELFKLRDMPLSRLYVLREIIGQAYDIKKRDVITEDLS